MNILRRYIINPFHILACKIRHNKISATSIIDGWGYMKGCEVGKYCFIGDNFNFNYVHIGNYSCIASNVQIGGMEHSINDLSIFPLLYPEHCVDDEVTIIGHDVWICGQVVIKQGVRIGDGAVVGANSFVNKDVEPYAIVAGSPAKLLRYRTAKEKRRQLEDSKFWEFPPKKAKQLLDSIKY